jgi:group II intron reverse transcriptase/maturase/CRISPR-associated endonuclease Cas1
MEEISSIFPITAVTVRLRFKAHHYAPFFHHPQLKPFLKELISDKDSLDQEQGLWVDAIECGRTEFHINDEYRFNLFCLPRAYALFEKVIDKLRRLPQSFPQRRKFEGFLGAHLQFAGLKDFFTGQSITDIKQLFQYDQAAFQREKNFWDEQRNITLRFCSPARLKISKVRRNRPPYIQDRGCLQNGEIERKILKAIQNILPATGSEINSGVISYHVQSDRLYWTDNAHSLTSGKLSVFGGVLGDISLNKAVRDHPPHLPYLILGQYIGIGERRTYGLGRYRLQTQERQGTVPARQSACTQLELSSRISTLEQACYNITRKHPHLRKYIDHNLHDFDPDVEDQLNQPGLLNEVNLHQVAERMQSGLFEAGMLHGVILRQPGRHPRPLSIPPLEDRIAQRAVVEIMGPAIDQLSTTQSYGYRRGYSRLQARDRILALQRQGYQWFFEADIESFFDLLSHEEIENRLLSFFPDEPLIPLISQWVRAPVKFEDQIIERKTGLPQGSPISPMLANMMLEDFDADLESAGMKLVRFADDFVILCKNRQQAEQASERAQQSLAEIGLQFNPDKTRVGKFSDGFKFLGYVFINDYAIEKKNTTNQAGSALNISQVPRASWLAQLLLRQPEMLNELHNRIDQKHPTLAKLKASNPNAFPENDLGSSLFICQPGKIIRQKQGRLHIYDEDNQLIQHCNWNDVNNIVLYGRHHLSQPCLEAAMANEVSVHYCSTNGAYLGMSTHARPSQQGPELWLQQTAAWKEESPVRIALCRNLVASRIYNQMQVIRQRARHESIPLEAIDKIKRLYDKLGQAESIDQIRGYEGGASAIYLRQISDWLPEAFQFTSRSRRPPLDPFNALLSLGYSILYSHSASILQIAGLYPWQGFYHIGRGKHLALASDIMESYRHIVERCALTVIRSGQLKKEDFYTLKNGACQLTRAGLKSYLYQLNSRILKPVGSKNIDTVLPLQQHLMHTVHQLINHIRNPETEVHFFEVK